MLSIGCISGCLLGGGGPTLALRHTTAGTGLAVGFDADLGMGLSTSPDITSIVGGGGGFEKPFLSGSGSQDLIGYGYFQALVGDDRFARLAIGAMNAASDPGVHIMFAGSVGLAHPAFFSKCRGAAPSIEVGVRITAGAFEIFATPRAYVYDGSFCD